MLGGCGKSAIPELLHQLHDVEIRSSVAYGFVQIGKPAVKNLIQALASDEKAVRTGAAKALEEIGGLSMAAREKATGKIVGFRTAAMVPGKLGEVDEALIPTLIKVLHQDFGRDVAEVAAGTLVYVGKPAVAPLTKALKDDAPSVRVWAAAILYRIKLCRDYETWEPPRPAKGTLH